MLFLKSNQQLVTYRTWLLQDARNRFVIDIPGKWVVADGVKLSFDTSLKKVDRIGIAEHADHLRIAIRLRSNSAPYDPEIQSTAEGLQVELD